MKLTVAKLIVADGNEIELAMYTHALLEIFRLKNEMETEESKTKEETAREFEQILLKALFRDTEDDAEE